MKMALLLLSQKNPYGRSVIPFFSVIKKKVGFKQPKVFGHMIHYRDLAAGMQNAGFKDINVYPATVSVHHPSSAYLHKLGLSLSDWIFGRIHRKRINPFYIPIIDSYCITARKG